MKKIILIPLDCDEKFCKNCKFNTKDIYYCDLWNKQVGFISSIYHINRTKECLDAEISETNLLNGLNNDNKKYIKIEITTFNNSCNYNCKFLAISRKFNQRKCIVFDCKLFLEPFSSNFRRCDECLKYEKEYYVN